MTTSENRETDAIVGVPTPRCICGRHALRMRLRPEKLMSAKPPDMFGLDRLETPIGTALLVTDADGILCALDWADHELRMRELLRRQYGTLPMKSAQAPGDLRSALSGYFVGELGQLGTIRWRVAGTPFQRKVWTALTTIPAGTTMSY